MYSIEIINALNSLFHNYRAGKL